MRNKANAQRGRGARPLWGQGQARRGSSTLPQSPSEIRRGKATSDCLWQSLIVGRDSAFGADCALSP